MQSPFEVADGFTSLLAAGNAEAAADKYWAPDITSIEPGDLPDGTPAIVKGFEASRAKLMRWMNHNSMEDVMVDGPFVTGNHFALFIDMEIVSRDTGKHQPFSEITVYTVHGGKITKERHFHG